MTSYFIRRLLLAVPTFLGITLLVFTITRFVPGGPVDKIISQARLMSQSTDRGGGSSTSLETGSPLSDDQIEELKAFYGFDKPIYQRISFWVNDISMNFSC